jgi:hypothetical protein
MMLPLLMAAWQACEGMGQLVGLSHPTAWQQREITDCGVVALRAYLASSVLGKKTMTLAELLPGFSSAPATAAHSTAAGRSITPATSIWLPTGHFEPNRSADHVTNERFQELLQDFRDRPSASNFSWVGPGNSGADAFLFFKQVDRADYPLVVVLSSKQRQQTGQQSVTGADIEKERDKGIMLTGEPDSLTFDWLYVYLTDQQVTSMPTGHPVIVIGPEQHEASYGSIARTLELAKQMH